MATAGCSKTARIGHRPLPQAIHGSTNIRGRKSFQLLRLVQDLTPRELEGCSEKKLKFQEVSQHSESRTLDARDLRRKLRSKRSRSMSGSPERNPSVFSRIRRDRSESPRHRPEGRRDGGVFNILGDTEAFSESEDSRGGHWKSRPKKANSSIEEDELSQPWVLETDIRQKDEKQSQKRQNRAWNGKAWKSQSQPSQSQPRQSQRSKSKPKPKKC
ncbi:hypothetical protein Tco_0569607 [Tanacetum coccineum]